MSATARERGQGGGFSGIGHAARRGRHRRGVAGPAHPRHRSVRANVVGVVGAAIAAIAMSTPVTLAADGPEIHTQTWTYGPYDIPAHGLMQVPDGVQHVSFEEAVWVVGYRTEIVDAEGAVLDKNYHCHSQIKTGFEGEWQHLGRDGAPYKGLFSDGHVTELRAPDGFGIPFAGDETVMVFPAFNNRDKEPLHAAMRVIVDYVLAEDALAAGMKPLFGTTLSVQHPHLYYVNPGVDERSAEIEMPYDGIVRLMAAHIHPYGKSVSLYNVTRDEEVWTALGDRGDDGRILTMPVYDKRDGYAVKAGETYRLTVTYDNPTRYAQDAMGGLFVLFTTEDDAMPAPPEGAPRVEHHGHDHGH